MEDTAALKARLQALSPEQRSALLQKLAAMRQQEERRASRNQSYPLSFAQRRLWLLSQLGDEASAAYNIASVFRFDKSLDVERLHRAWLNLLARHEVLRSAFLQQGDELVQQPRAAADWELQRRTFAADSDLDAQLVQLATAEAAKPFDLQHDWLLKVIYCESGAGTAESGAGLVVVIHHIVCDGISIAGMIRELAQDYAQPAPHAAAVPESGRPAALQYRDYVAFEATADTTRALAYWKQIFASAPETLDALLDLPRPAQRDFRGAAVSLTLPTPAVAAFEALCHAQQCTLYMGLVALVQTVLARMANVAEVTLGTPVAGRPGAQFASVAGPFVNTIALRQGISRQQDFGALLQQTRRAVLGGFEHQGLAFDELVTGLGFAKDPSRSPLYDVMLGLNFADDMALVFGDSVGHPLRITPAFSKVDLTFHFEKETDGSLRLDLEYASAVLLQTSAARLCQALQLLFVAIPQAPARALGSFALQTDAERRALLEGVNATARPYPRQASLVGEFRRVAARCADAIAVHAGECRLSYRTLDEQSDRVALRLLQHPAHRAGCCIALLLEKDERALIVILAILKSGAVYLPLAASTPLERVAQVLEAGSAPLLFAETARQAGLQTLPVALLDIDTLLGDAEAPGQASCTGLSQASALLQQDESQAASIPAYLMFTSGSTGKPKGTLIEQRAVLRLVCNTDYHQVQANERVLLTGSLAFDAATFEIWGPLLNGGCVCIPAGTTLLEVHEFQALVDHYRIDTAFLTTGLFNQLVDNSVTAFAGLQTVLTGGEKVSVGHVRKLLQMHPALKLLHVYGPTENTTFSSWHRIQPEDLSLPTIPIGKPIANSRLYLLDAELQPVPTGVPGEIYCGGDGIARGYLEPSTVFLPDPFVPPGNGRLYRTGDLAKWNAQHELVFLGRNDRQVKIRGFRVELAEVEYHLRRIPGVADAHVQARGDAGSSMLVAWLVLSEQRSMSLTDVREALQGTVPNYMLPARLMCLERLPLNASGKVDVRALPLPDAADSDVAETAQLHGRVEQELAALYAKALGLPESAASGIDRSANFFSLGGDSIRAIQLVSLARAAGYHFALKDLFASETLAGLAALVATTTQDTTAAVLRSGPLSPTQLWWLDTCGRPANHFNLSSVFRVGTAVDVDALREALAALVDLHPALRLSLDSAAQQQRIRDKGSFLLQVGTAGQSRQQCWDALQQAIDLERGTLLAVAVVPETDATTLAVVVHHLAADEVSGRLFAENLVRAYQRSLLQRRGESTEAMPVPLQEALGPINWAAQLQALVEQGGMDHDLPFWQDSVSRGRAVLAAQQGLFPASCARRSEAEQTLPASQTQVLLQQARTGLRLSPQELLLASFTRAWQISTGHADCLLMLEGHGRESISGLGDCSSTLGWFTSLYPVVLGGDVAQDLELYRSTRDALRSVPARGFTYLPLRYCRNADTRAALALQPQLSFNYLGENQSDDSGWLQTSDETAGADHGSNVTEPFRLDVLARVNAGQLQLTLRGQALRADLDLRALAAAWQRELEVLALRLQQQQQQQQQHQPPAFSADHELALLALSDSLVPFATLADLDATLAALHLQPSAVEEILPLTSVQAGMWLHCTGNSTAYQDQVVLRLQQSLDEPRFAAAVQALVAETQALRTGFAQSRRGELLQIVLRERHDNYRFVDASAGNSAGGEAMAELRAGSRGRARDLLNDSLFNLTLVRVHAACYELIIDFHHMALDGWTSALLLQRLEALYFAEASTGDGRAASGMRRYFEWLLQQSPAQAREYWQNLLGDYQNRSELPPQVPRVPALEPSPLFVEVRTGATLHAALLAWCAQQGLTVSAAVQALWGLFLGRLTGSDDVVFGATVSGRDINLVGVDTIAGMLINTLPVRINSADAASFADLVRQTAQQFAQSMAFGHLGLADINMLTPARGGLVTHALVFENYPGADRNARWQWEPQDIFDPMHFEFGLIVAPLAQDLSFRFVADGALYLRERLEEMGAALCTLLAQLLDAQQPFTPLKVDVPRAWTVSANFTADSLVGMLQYHEYIKGNSAAVTLLPYDQSVQELLNPDSRLGRLQAVHHVVLWRPALDAAGALLESATAGQLAQLADALASYARRCSSSQLYVVPCPWFDCNWTLYRENSAWLKGALAGLANVAVLGLEALAAEYALPQPCHPPGQVFGDIPYTEAFFAAVATRLQRQRDLQTRRPVKVYVVDADDTLWGGVVGEEGAHGVRLDAVHLRLQEQLLKARQAGALLCLATKNNEDDVRAVFEQREMPLRWSHLTRVCAAWGPKSQSILALAEELSLGLDSFVFIDDSPLECEQVLDACPGVVAIQLPAAEQREAFLRHLWLLDTRAATLEDTRRAQMYAEELQRSSARQASGSYADFLRSLDIRVKMQPLVQADLARTAQLSQRTNQFNTCGIRYTEAELAALQQPGTQIRCVRVQDKYGDYGLVGSVYLQTGAEAWTVFGLMLSCRVLGRGVEHSILRELAAEALAAGAAALQVDFVKLPRNAPALQFLQSLGAAAAALPAGAQAWQFVLPVTAAASWQPGGDAAAAEPDVDDATAAQGGAATLAAAGTLQRWSMRASAYYSQLAGDLASGSAILRAQQQAGLSGIAGAVARSKAGSTPPATATEVMVAGYFAELLGQSHISREDSFHGLGGHSLKAVLLFARIAADFGCALDFRDLQAAPTVAALAARIDDAAAEAVPATTPVLEVLPTADSYAASPGQARLWMLEQIRSEGPSPFHMHATLKVPGAVERAALDQALRALLRRHEALRTCFRADVAGGIRQVVVPAESLDTGVQWFNESLDVAAIELQAQQHCAQAFDLQQAPLLRVAAAALQDGGTVLFITLHHIISDGWSIGVLARELSLLYRHAGADADRSDAARLAPPSRVQFRDFAQWQLDWLQSAAGLQATDFWRAHFAEPVEALQLPSAAPRPALLRSSGAAVHSSIPAPLWGSFTNAVATLGLSQFAGLFAALQLVLARLSGQHNFCIGTAVAGRQHAGLDAVIGFFVNVLPLRSTLEPNSSVVDFLHAVAAEVSACLSHQGVPFDTIVSGLALERDPGRSPLFDVLLVLQNTGPAELRFGEYEAAVHPVATTTSQYDLVLNAFPEADGSLQLVAEYNSSIYAAANIELLLRCLQRTLQALLETLACNARAGSSLPSARAQGLAGLPWLQDFDIAQVRTFEGKLQQSKALWLPDMVRAALRSKGRISDAVTNWSYAELQQEMDRISAVLGTLEPLQARLMARQRKQAHVGVIGRRSARSVAALLGVMDAGAVYVPLDLANPLQRLHTIIEEGALDAVLSTDEEGAALVDALQQKQNQKQQQPELLHIRYEEIAQGSGPRPVSADPADIAYMIFTSGSTGKPKGVQIPHAAFAAMITQQIPAFAVGADDVCGQFAALSFDASLSEIFLALGTGASLAVAPDEIRGDIDQFMAWLEGSAVTVLTLPPVFLRALGRRPLGKLRVLVTAGEAAVAEDLRHYARQLRVINAYGPTETSVCASTYVVDTADAWPFGVPIGAPLPGVLLSVRDARGERVPAGVAGELYIGGGSVGAGYHAAPELSAQKFTTLPAEQGRWYRSGDSVRWRSDGQLEFLGRLDTQLKLRGYRIEPGEIEHAARACANVVDAVVLMHAELGLVLYCVAATVQDDALFAAQVLKALGSSLPRHMVPAAVLRVDAFPLSSAGKIDRAALLALAVRRERHFEAPRGGAEQALAQVWQQALQLERIGRQDQFFALGGDSIKALAVQAALRTLGYRCNLKDFFAAPQLSALAELLVPTADSERGEPPLTGRVPLLPVQQWFLQTRDSDSAGHFNIAAELKVSPLLTAPLLGRIVAELVRQHDSLRASFRQVDGLWVQELTELAPESPDVAGLQIHRCVAGYDASERALVAAQACRPFELQQAPLFRFVLVQDAAATSVAVVLVLHHLIADWVSLRILLADMNALAATLLAGETGAGGWLPPPHQLLALAQSRTVRPATLPAVSESAPFQQAVAVMAALAFDPGVHSELHTRHLRLDPEALLRLRQHLQQESAAQQQDFRMQDLLLAASMTALAGLFDVTSVPVLIEGHGRDDVLDLARQVAWLTQARVVNLECAAFTGQAALLQAQRALQVPAQAQPDVFTCMAAQAEPMRGLPALLGFNYLGEFSEGPEQTALFSLTDTVFEQVMSPCTPVDVPLQVECYVMQQALEIQIAWSPRVLDSSRMHDCLQRLQQYLLRPFGPA